MVMAPMMTPEVISWSDALSSVVMLGSAFPSRWSMKAPCTIQKML